MFGKCQCEAHRGENFEQQLHGHHRAEISQYPEYKKDPKNIIWVCPSCHLNKIHKCGNTKVLSTYGEGLKYEYLRSVGEVKSMKRDIFQKKVVYHASGKSCDNGEPTTPNGGYNKVVEKILLILTVICMIAMLLYTDAKLLAIIGIVIVSIVFYKDHY